MGGHSLARSRGVACPDQSAAHRAALRIRDRQPHPRHPAPPGAARRRRAGAARSSPAPPAAPPHQRAISWSSRRGSGPGHHERSAATRPPWPTRATPGRQTARRPETGPRSSVAPGRAPTPRGPTPPPSWRRATHRHSKRAPARSAGGAKAYRAGAAGPRGTRQRARGRAAHRPRRGSAVLSGHPSGSRGARRMTRPAPHAGA